MAIERLLAAGGPAHKRGDRPGSSSAKGVYSALWLRGRRCRRDHSDNGEVNSYAREDDTYTVVPHIALRCRDSRTSCIAQGNRRHHGFIERRNSCCRNGSAARYLVACQRCAFGAYFWLRPIGACHP